MCMCIMTNQSIVLLCNCCYKGMAHMLKLIICYSVIHQSVGLSRCVFHGVFHKHMYTCFSSLLSNCPEIPSDRVGNYVEHDRHGSGGISTHSSGGVEVTGRSSYWHLMHTYLSCQLSRQFPWAYPLQNLIILSMVSGTKTALGLSHQRGKRHRL